MLTARLLSPSRRPALPADISGRDEAMATHSPTEIRPESSLTLTPVSRRRPPRPTGRAGRGPTCQAAEAECHFGLSLVGGEVTQHASAACRTSARSPRAEEDQASMFWISVRFEKWQPIHESLSLAGEPESASGSVPRGCTTTGHRGRHSGARAVVELPGDGRPLLADPSGFRSFPGVGHRSLVAASNGMNASATIDQPITDRSVAFSTELVDLVDIPMTLRLAQGRPDRSAPAAEDHELAAHRLEEVRRSAQLPPIRAAVAYASVAWLPPPKMSPSRTHSSGSSSRGAISIAARRWRADSSNAAPAFARWPPG